VIHLCAIAVSDLGCVVDLACASGSTWLAPVTGPRRRRGPSSDEAFADAVFVAVDTLPIDQAQALWLVDVCGCSYQQAAIEASANQAAIARRVRRGRETVRHRIA